jgi:hypothetical protein
MSIIIHRAAALISKHVTNQLNTAEKKELDAWIEADSQHKQLFIELTSPARHRANLKNPLPVNKRAAWRNVLQRLSDTARKPLFFQKRHTVMKLLAPQVVLLKQMPIQKKDLAKLICS